MRTAQILTISSLLFVTACGKEPLKLADAKKAFVSAQSALPTTSSLEGVKSGQEFPCTNGGHVRVVEAPKQEDRGKSQRLKIAYEKCDMEGTTIDGTYDIEATISQNTQIKAHLSGELSFSGKVNGDCDVDMRLEVKGSSKSSIKLTGNFCGQNIEDF